MKTVAVKSIITTNKSEYWFGERFNMNLYRGCCHGCIYCDSRSECYRIEDFDTVRAKANAVQIVESELRGKTRKGVIGTGSMSDPYNPFERREQLTRGALTSIRDHRFGISIATKSSLVTRDIDLLRQIAESMPVLVRITITAVDDTLARRVEPFAPSSSERFAALSALSKAGIQCGILLMPVLPFITDAWENIRSIVRRAAECGAGFVYPYFGVTLRDNQRAYYCTKLDERFPGVRALTVDRYAGQYACQIPGAEEVQAAFEAGCAERGLLYRMPEIINWYQREYDNQQLTLF